ncbi:hypothetical protein E2C01_077234 [Portunus trituberculatus]|uniref:CD80-like immunoglobulin C2-set domain-containing protein n=1 Tax=Portunus trituberculatus TaxID=210409 RepID=A0A5B7IAW2_PORTR|nr:hypothetical protein [Portunus trituberculatus]
MLLLLLLLLSPPPPLLLLLLLLQLLLLLLLLLPPPPLRQTIPLPQLILPFRGATYIFKLSISCPLPRQDHHHYYHHHHHHHHYPHFLSPTDLPDRVPTITGGRSRYHVGDEVHVNCTSLRSRPAASLMWYINDNQVSQPLSHPLSHTSSGLCNVRGKTDQGQQK